MSKTTKLADVIPFPFDRVQPSTTAAQPQPVEKRAPYTPPPVVTGSKYDPTMDIVDLAYAVKRDIKDAQRSGTLRPGRVSVRSERYSGGQSLHVTLYIDPVAFAVMDETSKRVVHVKLANIVAAYQRDASDAMVDYFDVNFYDHITVCADDSKRST